MRKNYPKISLDDLAKEKLTEKLLSAIQVTEIEIGTEIQSEFTLKIDKKEFQCKLIFKTSLKKFLAWVGGLAATTGGIVTILKWLVPLLVAHFSSTP